jgi:hypothetical protein
VRSTDLGQVQYYGSVVSFERDWLVEITMGSLFQLEKAPQLIAAVTAVILCMSVVHDAGYFLVIGREFQSFMSPTDYIASAITWLPLVLLSVAFVGMVQLALGRRSNFETRRIPLKSKRATMTATKAVIAVVLYIALCGLVCFGENLVTGPDMFLILLFFPWLFFWGWILSHEKLRRYIGMRGVFLTLIGVPFMAEIFCMGVRDASSAVLSEAREFSLTVSTDAPKIIIVLRNIDRGVIFREPASNTIAFVKWSDIRSLSRIGVHVDQRPVSCQTLSWHCTMFFGAPSRL